MATISELEDAKRTMIEYLKLKVKQEDWHGCADAAMDIREIDAKLSVLRERLQDGKPKDRPIIQYAKNIVEL